MLLRQGYFLTVLPAQALFYIYVVEIHIVLITVSMTNAQVNKAQATLKSHRTPSSLLVLRGDEEQLIK